MSAKDDLRGFLVVIFICVMVPSCWAQTRPPQVLAYPQVVTGAGLKYTYNITKAAKPAKLSLEGWYKMARSFMGMVQKDPLNLDELGKIQNSSLAPLTDKRGGAMLVLMAVGGVYVLTMISLLIYFLMALGVFEPSRIRFHPNGGKALRISLTVGTITFTAGLMAGTALMIVSSSEYGSSLTTSGPIVEAAFSDMKSYVLNTMDQIFDDKIGIAENGLQQIQGNLSAQMTPQGSFLQSAVTQMSSVYSVYAKSVTDTTAAITKAKTDLSTFVQTAGQPYKLLSDVNNKMADLGGRMDAIIKSANCIDPFCTDLIGGPRSLSQKFSNIESVNFKPLTDNILLQLTQLQGIVDSINPVTAISSGLATNLFVTNNFRDSVNYKLLTYKTVLIKTDLLKIRTSLLEQLSKKLDIWRPMVQRILDPSVSSNINAAVGIYAFIFFVVCIVTFSGTGIGLMYFKPEVRPHHRKNNQVVGGTLLMSALYIVLVFSWGAMIATSYLMVYVSQLDGALCAALNGESTGFTKLRTGIRAMEANASGPMGNIPFAYPPPGSVDLASSILNCKQNQPAHTGFNMSAFWSADDLRKHVATFGFNISFNNMATKDAIVQIIDQNTKDTHTATVTAMFPPTGMDAIKNAKFNFSTALSNWKTTTAKSPADTTSTTLYSPMDANFFTEYSNMLLMTMPLLASFIGSDAVGNSIAPDTKKLQDSHGTPIQTNLVDASGKVAALQTTLTALTGTVKSLLDSALALQTSSFAVDKKPNFDAVTKNFATQINNVIANYVDKSLIAGLQTTVGQCKAVYDAFTAMTNTLCSSTTPPLMGVWFGAGLCVFSLAFMVPLIYQLSRFYTQGKTAKDGAGRPSMFSIARESVLSRFSNGSRKSSSRKSGKNSRELSRNSKRSVESSGASKQARPSGTPASGARLSAPIVTGRPAVPAFAVARPLTPVAGQTPPSTAPRPGSVTAAPPRPATPTAGARSSYPSAGPARPSTLSPATTPAVPFRARDVSRPSAAALATAAGASRPSIMARPPAR